MKRKIILILCLAAAGTFAVLQAQEDTLTPHCDVVVETADAEEECCCSGTTDGCEGDCESCDACTCDCESDCGSDCEDCTCDETECGCDDCTPEEEAEVGTGHCGGCH